MGHPTVYPTGVTVFTPEKAWPGYTLFQAAGLGALLIDPHGKEVKLWNGVQGFPNKLLPGGRLLTSLAVRDPKVAFQDQSDLSQITWDGEVEWSFTKNQKATDPGKEEQWFARQHHDFQRQGNPVGYFVPEAQPLTEGGNSLVLTHDNVSIPEVADHQLLDDRIIEIDWEGNILWEWNASAHFAEWGFNDAQLRALNGNPNLVATEVRYGDWLHINSASYLGENPWFAAGDERFKPENIIVSSREANILAIISKADGKIVWRVGPNYGPGTPEANLQQIIGPHHVHLIPKGLPGAGNILVFDNGGWGGYGEANPNSFDGTKVARRDHSRVLEFNPQTLEIVWQFTPKELGVIEPLDSSRFYSPFVSSAQRLPNGNTLITEGSDGRLIEVTADHEIVWEYLSPYNGSGIQKISLVYRAYRYPFDWVPQLTPAELHPIERLNPADFTVPGAAQRGIVENTRVQGVEPLSEDPDFCVIPNRFSVSKD